MLNHLTRYMEYLQKDMAVHTDNVARADMPGQTPKSLKPFSEMVQQGSTQKIRTTNSGHLSGTSSHLSAQEVTYGKKNDHYISGNSIDREDEIQKINDIGTEYMKANRLYRKASELTKNMLNFRG